jgi:hypothetical protein
MDPSLSAAQFGGAAGMNGPLGSSGAPAAIGNSSSGMSGSMAGSAACP